MLLSEPEPSRTRQRFFRRTTRISAEMVSVARYGFIISAGGARGRVSLDVRNGHRAPWLQQRACLPNHRRRGRRSGVGRFATCRSKPPNARVVCGGVGLRIGVTWWPALTIVSVWECRSGGFEPAWGADLPFTIRRSRCACSRPTANAGVLSICSSDSGPPSSHRADVELRWVRLRTLRDKVFIGWRRAPARQGGEERAYRA